MDVKHIWILIIHEFKLDHKPNRDWKECKKKIGDGTVWERTIQRKFQKIRSDDMNLENKPEHQSWKTTNRDSYWGWSAPNCKWYGRTVKDMLFAVYWSLPTINSIKLPNMKSFRRLLWALHTCLRNMSFVPLWNDDQHNG